MLVLDQLPDEPSAPHQRSVLSCPTCRAPCPLGFSDTTTCVSCGTVVPLPAELIADRDKRRARGRQRRHDDPLWQRALRARVRFWRSPLFLTPLSYLAPFAAAIAGYFYGYRQGKYGQAGFVGLCVVGVVHFLTSILLESRKEEQLRALLLARRPEKDAGPPVCRVCAAPLSPIAGEPDCTCDHCGADNILGRGNDGIASRPDLFDAEAALREVYGDEVNQRASRLYPLMIFLGFLVLAVLTFYAVEAPRTPLP